MQEPDVITGTLGVLVKRQAEATRGANEDANGDVGATRGAC
jgi:hypothetical protein